MLPDQIPWAERKFDFDFPAGLFPELIERLRGTPFRIEALAGSVAPETLVRGYENRWSIQENIGHLADLETLFLGRLDEFEAGAGTLRSADMSNIKTEEADHNSRPLTEILTELRGQREQLVTRLESLEPKAFARRAFHARLNVPMRLVDMCFFQAEHDDHHIARMRWLQRKLST